MRISDWSSDVCSSDLYIEGKLLGDDAALDAALAANHAGGLPAIDVSAVQGRFLHLLALAGRAARILAVGTLGGYSTIELARGLVAGGRVRSGARRVGKECVSTCNSRWLPSP